MRKFCHSGTLKRIKCYQKPKNWWEMDGELPFFIIEAYENHISFGEKIYVIGSMGRKIHVTASSVASELQIEAKIRAGEFKFMEML